MILGKKEYGRTQFTEKDMHIAFGIDENFARAAGVAITSILENNKNVIFHIFSDNIKSDDCERFRKTAEKYHAGCILYFLNPEIFKSFPTATGWTIATYYRFLVGTYFFGKLKKIIYMDADMICKGDMHQLYDLDLQGKGIAGYKENGGMAQQHIRRLKLTGEGYFNAGMLLIDIDFWHEHDIFSQAIELLSASGAKRFLYLDQDVLNLLYQDKAVFIPVKYNQMSNKKDDYPADTVIIHYFGTPKPWLYWYRCSGANYFHYYSERSFWVDVPIEDCPRNARDTRRMAEACLRHGRLFDGIYWFGKFIWLKVTGSK